MKRLLLLCLVLSCGTNLFDLADNAGKGAIALLRPTRGMLDPAFSPTVMKYQLKRLSHADAEVAFVATSYLAGTRIIYKSGGLVSTNAPGEQSLPFPLVSGRETAISVGVEHPNGKTSWYEFFAYRPSAADLVNLTVEGHELEPCFDPLQTEYTVKLPGPGGTVRIIAEHAGASSVTINGITGYDQLLTVAAALPWTVVIEVCGGGSCKTYRIVFIDGGVSVAKSDRLSGLWSDEALLDPPFSPEILDYTLTLPTNPGSRRFQAVAEDGSATIKIDGIHHNSGEWYVSSSMDGLTPGVDGLVIPVSVTSADGATTRTYNVSVRMSQTFPVNIMLTAAEGPPLPFSFSSGTLTYSVILNSANTNIMCNVDKRPDQTVTINGIESISFPMMFPGPDVISFTIAVTHWGFTASYVITCTKF